MAKSETYLDVKECLGFEDLSGDPVYDSIKDGILDGGLLLGGKIETPIFHNASSPRKIIHIAVYNHDDGETVRYVLNYNRILRTINKELN